MAKPDHVKLVRAGSESVRQWKKANLGGDLDLADAALSGIVLEDVPLGYADFSGADLSGARFAGCILESAVFRGAILRDARITRASGALVCLEDADLSGATISESNLAGGDFRCRAMQGLTIQECNLNRIRVSRSFVDAATVDCELSYRGIIPGHRMETYASFDYLVSFARRRRQGQWISWRENLRGRVLMHTWGFRLMFRWAREISWPFVHRFGKLQVLTKASYVMLVAVPLLAGVWPVVRAALGRARASTGNAQIAPEAGALDTLDLPLPFALAFFGSLAVVIGYALFEWWAPDLVKKSSRDQHLSAATRLIASGGPDSLAMIVERALWTLRTNADYKPDRYHPDLLEHLGRIYMIPKEASEILPDDSAAVTAVVEGAASREYDRAGEKSPAAAVTAAVAYGAALCILVYLLASQAAVVWREAGIGALVRSAL